MLHISGTFWRYKSNDMEDHTQQREVHCIQGCFIFYQISILSFLTIALTLNMYFDVTSPVLSVFIGNVYRVKNNIPRNLKEEPPLCCVHLGWSTGQNMWWKSCIEDWRIWTCSSIMGGKKSSCRGNRHSSCPSWYPPRGGSLDEFSSHSGWCADSGDQGGPKLFCGNNDLYKGPISHGRRSASLHAVNYDSTGGLCFNPSDRQSEQGRVSP